MDERWVFDFSVLDEADLRAFASAARSPITEFMHLVGKAVTDGPVQIDWSDRYGWSQLTLIQFNEFMQQADGALRAFLNELRRRNTGT
jgi:hypothetical protein